jgi:hypothetical protein
MRRYGHLFLGMRLRMTPTDDLWWNCEKLTWRLYSFLAYDTQVFFYNTEDWWFWENFSNFLCGRKRERGTVTENEEFWLISLWIETRVVNKIFEVKIKIHCYNGNSLNLTMSVEIALLVFFFFFFRTLCYVLSKCQIVSECYKIVSCLYYYI